MEILAIIPARSGSKGLPHKNILQLDGKPMMAYSIELALKSKLITRVIISTDSIEYMEIARQHGAEAPFVRPAEFAQDDSLDIDAFHHALSWLRDNEGYVPDICVQLRPCGPIRDSVLVDKIIRRLVDNPKFDSIRAVARSTEVPYKMWNMTGDNTLTPIVKDIPECYNMPRQNLPEAYFQNGYVDAFRPHVVLEQCSMTGNVIGGYVVDEYFDIDYPEDVYLVEACLKTRTKQQSFLVDADNILTNNTDSHIEKNIDIIASLKKTNHFVYIKCKDEDRDEIAAKLVNIPIDRFVSEFMESDYIISAKTMSMTALERIIGK